MKLVGHSTFGSAGLASFSDHDEADSESPAGVSLI
jgi:hypothetical protein